MSIVFDVDNRWTDVLLIYNVAFKEPWRVNYYFGEATTILQSGIASITRRRVAASSKIQRFIKEYYIYDVLILHFCQTLFLPR